MKYTHPLNSFISLAIAISLFFSAAYFLFPTAYTSMAFKANQTEIF